MLKIGFRVVLILLVAGLVSGGLYLMLNNSSDQTAGLEGSFEGRPASGVTSATDSSAVSVDGSTQAGTTAQFPSGGERPEGGSSAMSLIGILGNLAKIAGITFIVVMLQKIICKVLRKPALACNNSTNE
jgi:hypothetical protein